MIKPEAAQFLICEVQISAIEKIAQKMGDSEGGLAILDKSLRKAPLIR